jgi:hypothetical protein
MAKRRKQGREGEGRGGEGRKERKGKERKKNAGDVEKKELIYC